MQISVFVHAVTNYECNSAVKNGRDENTLGLGNRRTDTRTDSGMEEQGHIYMPTPLKVVRA